MTFGVRPAQSGDTPLVLALIRELAEYERLLDQVNATEKLLADALFCPNPRVFCDIAEWTPRGEDPAEPAGFALWFYNFSTFHGRHGIYLEDLFVRPRFRGHGIGKALLTELAKRCAAEGLTRLEWHVLDWNEPSIGFYRALGAEMLDEWRRCRVSGSALMRLAGQSA